MNSGKVRFLSLAILLPPLLGATAAYSQAPPASVTVTPVAPSVTVYGNAAVVQAGLSQQFEATVVNDPTNSGVTWRIGSFGCVPQRCGNIDATGKYTAPTTPLDFG